MEINGVLIEDCVTGGYAMVATRILLTADTSAWASMAASGLACALGGDDSAPTDANIERSLSPLTTPDGRPGTSMLAFAATPEALLANVHKQLLWVGMNCPTGAVFSGMEDATNLPIDAALERLGGAYARGLEVDGRACLAIPAMDGEFVCQTQFGYGPALGGAHLLIFASERSACLTAAQAAADAITGCVNVIVPPPCGVRRRLPGEDVATNAALCPTLRTRIKSALHHETVACLALVVHGLTADDVRHALSLAMNSVIDLGRDGGILALTAVNRDLATAAHRFRLQELAA